MTNKNNRPGSGSGQIYHLSNWELTEPDKTEIWIRHASILVTDDSSGSK